MFAFVLAVEWSPALPLSKECQAACVCEFLAWPDEFMSLLAVAIGRLLIVDVVLFV